MDLVQNILPYIVTILAIVISYYLNKWLKIKVEDIVIQNILNAIITEIVQIEKSPEYKYQSGLSKKNTVTRIVNEKFTDVNNEFYDKPKRNLLEKVFGSIENAVEKAFQVSHLARTAKFIFAGDK